MKRNWFKIFMYVGAFLIVGAGVFFFFTDDELLFINASFLVYCMFALNFIFYGYVLTQKDKKENDNETKSK